MSQHFPNKEHLKSDKAIQALFQDGKVIQKYPLRLVWLKQDNPNIQNHLAAFTASKRKFKKAVDRNLLKRRMREAYRKNKNLLASSTRKNDFAYFIFILVGDKIPSYEKIESSTMNILERLEVELHSLDTKSSVE